MRKERVPARVADSVRDDLGPLERASWWLCGTWEGFVLFRISLPPEPAPASGRDRVSK